MVSERRGTKHIVLLVSRSFLCFSLCLYHFMFSFTLFALSRKLIDMKSKTIKIVLKILPPPRVLVLAMAHNGSGSSEPLG